MNYKMLKFPLAMLCPFLMTSCGNVGYKVTIPDTNGVTISPNTAKKGEDYVGVISIAKDLTTLVLPDALTKVTSGNKELLAGDGYTYEVKADHLTADFKVPSANIVGDISIQLDLVSDKVSKEEFESALKFEGVEYAQAAGEMEKINILEEHSPSVCHEDVKGTEIYAEHAADGKYYKYEKNDSGTWKKEEITKDQWPTIKVMYITFFEDMIEKGGLAYEQSEYKDGEYYWETTQSTNSAEAKIRMKFVNKKVTFCKADAKIDGEWITEENVDFTYNEYTPDLPDVPELPISR